jgi:general secretion pathway protein N
MRRFGLFLLLAVAFALTRLPASLMDRTLASATDGRLRIAAASGTFWRGDGLLASVDARRQLQARRPLAWRIGLAGGAPALWFGEHGRPLGQLRIDAGGVVLTALDLDIPAALVADAIEHPAARAGWGGNLRFSSPSLRCDWDRRCDGSLDVVWHDARVAILPDRRLGDYHATLRLAAGDAVFDVDTLAGEVRVAGHGTIPRAGRGSFDGTVEGDREIVERIPNIMDRNARLTGRPGAITVTFP